MKVLSKVFRRWNTIESKREKKSKHQKIEWKYTRMLWIFSPLHTWLHAWLACWLSIISLTDLPLQYHSSLFCVFMPFPFPKPLGFTDFDFVDNLFLSDPHCGNAYVHLRALPYTKHLHFLLLPSSPSCYLSWALPCVKQWQNFVFNFFLVIPPE